MDQNHDNRNRPGPISMAHSTTSNIANYANEPLSTPSSPSPNTRRWQRSDSMASIGSQLRRASRTFEESNLPEGFLSATGDVASTLLPMQEPGERPVSSPKLPLSPAPQAPVDSPISQGRASYTYGKVPPQVPPVREEEETQISKQGSSGSNRGPQVAFTSSPGLYPASFFSTGRVAAASISASKVLPPQGDATVASNDTNKGTVPYINGYHFPPKKPFAVSLKAGLYAFSRYATTPVGFFVVLYGLNVVAWGGMIFLLLCNAAPAMCNPTCNDINSPRRKWIEYDSQILNALFCVTGFGLAPWRFRDLYFLLKYRLGCDIMGLRRLAGIHRGWLRLVGSDRLPTHAGPDTVLVVPGSYSENAVPYPLSSIPDPPPTGVRAPPTRLWKLDFVVWMNVSNTFLQCCLSAFMWGYDRYTRPVWAVGLFVALAMTVATLAGVMIFIEGRRVKGIEGVPVTEDDLRRLVRDRELGIPHYNNLKDKKPKLDKEEIEGEREREKVKANS